MLATFAVGDEQFRIWVTNPTTIAALQARARGDTATFPAGTLRNGPGDRDHNAPWSWHFDPATTEMTEVAIELCDAEPSYVEANLADWMEQVGQFCPWSAQLVGIDDRR